MSVENPRGVDSAPDSKVDAAEVGAPGHRIRLIGSSALGGLLAIHRGTMLLLASVSFVGALLEALLLVIITAMGVALAASTTVVGPVLGHLLPLNTALVIAGGVLVVRLGLNMTGSSIAARLSATVTRRQRMVLTHAYLDADWPTQQGEPPGRLQELLTSFVSRTNQTIMMLTQAITAFLSLLAFVGTGIAVQPISAIAVIAVLLLVATLLIPLRQAIRRRSVTLSNESLAFASTVSELGSLGLEMQTFGIQHQLTDRIDELNRLTAYHQRRVLALSGALSPVYIAVAYTALLGGIAALAALDFGDLTVIGAIMLLMLRSLSFGQQLASAWGSLAANAPFLDHIEEAVNRYQATPAPSGAVTPRSATPIEAVDVSFVYPNGQMALRHARFKIEPGEIVGVIGPSGSGKSTLAQLLLGLREPTSGAVLACGTALRQVDRNWWTDHVAFVAQDALLFTGTVAENIRFFRGGFDAPALHEAAAKAHILDDIQALPNGFNTRLGNRGGQLSGGQRQRLCIARALAGRPEVLVLDEPTSALDGRSEALIRKTLETLKGQTTVIMIAHRMSTLDICDRIMVIEGGRVTGFDAPSVLLERNRFYRYALRGAGITHFELAENTKNPKNPFNPTSPR